MRSSISIAVVFAATALASPRPVAEIVQVREIAKRQDLSSMDLGTLIPSGCLPPATLEPVPTPPSDILSDLMSWTNPCETPSFTGDASKEFASYTSALSSWAENVAPEYSSWQEAYATACPYASMATLEPSVTDAMSDFTNFGGCTATGGSSAAGGKTSGGADATAAGSTGAAPQQTAMAAAAGLFAGVVGVVAVL